jgi:hemerythrin-like domain-containing protein
MGMTVDQHTDTRDMLVAHGVLRREFREALELVSGVSPGDQARARPVAGHVVFLVQVLQLHDAGEDRLLWPKLLDRLPADVAPTVELMERQHEVIHALVEEVTATALRWRSSADVTERDRLVESLDRLLTELSEHLGAEEEQVLPLASRCLTQAEWDQLGEEGLGALPKRRLPLTFGMIMKDADPEVIRGILANVPIVPRVVLPRIGPRVYARYTRRLHTA